MPFKCSQCDQIHDQWPPDLAFGRPDEVFALPAAERQARVLENDDICILDGARFFIRTVAHVPMPGSGEQWGLGLWIEIAERDFKTYHDHYDLDGSDLAPLEGVVANQLPVLPDTLGSSARVQMGPSNRRPLVQVDPQSALGKLQREGVNDEHLHAILMPAVARPTPSRLRH